MIDGSEFFPAVEIDEGEEKDANAVKNDRPNYKFHYI